MPILRTNLWEPHLNTFINEYSKNFYWAKSQFLSPEQTSFLLQYAKVKEQEGRLKPAAIGKGEIKKRVSEIRSDQIYWIDNFKDNVGPLVQHIFEGLKEIVRKELYLPAKRFECHFAKYEKGDFYKTHRDRHNEKPGRLVTCVIYLTKCPYSSGYLTLYDNELRPIRINPEPGKILVFDSEIEHEVSISESERWSLTGWIRDDLHPGIRI